MAVSDFGSPTLSDRLGDLIARTQVAYDEATSRHSAARQALRDLDYDDPTWTAANATRKAAAQMQAELAAALNSLVKAFAAETRTTQDS